MARRFLVHWMKAGVVAHEKVMEADSLWQLVGPAFVSATAPPASIGDVDQLSIIETEAAPIEAPPVEPAPAPVEGEPQS